MLFLLAVNGSVFHLTLALYQSQEVPASDSRSNQVQGTLDQWPEHSKDWKELNRQLETFGYQLIVEDGQQVVYSSLNRFQRELYDHISPEASWPATGTLSLQYQRIYIIGRQCGNVVLVAMMEPQMPELFGRPRPPDEIALISFLITA